MLAEGILPLQDWAQGKGHGELYLFNVKNESKYLVVPSLFIIAIRESIRNLFRRGNRY